MRIFIISLIFIIFTTNKSFTQNLQTIDTIEVDTISNLKRFSFGIKMGIPNILGLTTEAILPIFKNRISPYFDYSSFKLNPDKTYITSSGEYKLPGRSVMLIRNVGHLMTNPAILLKNGEEIPEGIGCNDYFVNCNS